MTKEEKLCFLKEFLRKEKINFQEKCICKGQFMILFIPKYQICVRLSDANDQNFFERIKHYYHPLFIRENETAEFIVEKMQNLIIDLMQRKQRNYLRKKKA